MSIYLADPVRVGSQELSHCVNCGMSFDSDVETDTFYDTEDLVTEIQNRAPWSISVWDENAVQMAVSYVAEWDGFNCPSCGWIDTDNISTGDYYYCPTCGESHDTENSTPHEALLCCVHHVPGDQFDGCLSGVQNDMVDLSKARFIGCFCHSDCPYWICTVCHETFTGVEFERPHLSEHGMKNGDEINRIADVAEEEKPKPLPCLVCQAGENCCELHGFHVLPHHRGHILEPL